MSFYSRLGVSKLVVPLFLVADFSLKRQVTLGCSPTLRTESSKAIQWIHKTLIVRCCSINGVSHYQRQHCPSSEFIGEDIVVVDLHTNADVEDPLQRNIGLDLPFSTGLQYRELVNYT